MPQNTAVVTAQRGAFSDIYPRVENLSTSNTALLVQESIDVAVSIIQYNLAPELLIQIFSHTVHDPSEMTCKSVQDADFADSLNTKSGMWALSHVCSRWRGIITETSSLWTTVGLPFDNYPKSSATASFLATYLQRSNQHPLNVIIRSEEEISKHPAMNILMRTCARWRAAWLALPLDTFLAWEAPFPFKCLHKLLVCIQQGYEPGWPVLEEENPPMRCRAFQDAQVLHDVTVDNHVILLYLFTMNWTTLLVFCQQQKLSINFFQGYSSTDIFASLMILSKASSMKIAYLDYHPFDDGFEPHWQNLLDDYKSIHGGDLRNTELEFLALKGATESWRRMLANIDLPNLKILHCHPRFPYDPFPYPLPAATGSGLRKLVVHVINNDDTAHLKAFLELTPNLLDLSMFFNETFDIGPMCIEVFGMTPNSQLVPRLTTLTLTTFGHAKVMITSGVITALKQRVAGRNSILKVVITRSELIMKPTIESELKMPA